MAHKDWCGKRCENCEKPCNLDKNMPCSPDCGLLLPDGEQDKEACYQSGCDAIGWCKCKDCGTVIDWDSADDQKGIIWGCDECCEYFCEKCFEEKHGLEAAQNMWREDEEPILCPDCYGQKGRKIDGQN